jgi:hypothetical protein
MLPATADHLGARSRTRTCRASSFIRLRITSRSAQRRVTPEIHTSRLEVEMHLTPPIRLLHAVENETPFDSGPDHRQELVFGDRFLNEGISPITSRFLLSLTSARGHEDHRHLWPSFPHLIQGGETIQPRHSDIRHDDVVILLPQQIERRLHVERCFDRHITETPLYHLSER